MSLQRWLMVAVSLIWLSILAACVRAPLAGEPPVGAGSLAPMESVSEPRPEVDQANPADQADPAAQGVTPENAAPESAADGEELSDPAGEAPSGSLASELPPADRPDTLDGVEPVGPSAAAESLAPGAPVQGATPGGAGVELAPRAEPPARIRTIAIDPGHGGPEPGSINDDLVESRINLQIASALADLLRDDGYRVVLTRADNDSVSPLYIQPGVRSQVTLDLQARVDIANRAGADLFLSIHNNGSTNPSVRGTEVWFNNRRPFADRNRALAGLVLDNIVGRLRQAGYPTVNRGIQDDANFRVRNGRSFNIYVLGPGNGTRTPTQMPGALGESLFVSNPSDATALRRPAIQQAIALGYRDAVRAYFELYPD